MSISLIQYNKNAVSSFFQKCEPHSLMEWWPLTFPMYTFAQEHAPVVSGVRCIYVWIFWLIIGLRASSGNAARGKGPCPYDIFWDRKVLADHSAVLGWSVCVLREKVLWVKRKKRFTCILSDEVWRAKCHSLLDARVSLLMCDLQYYL